MMPETKSKRDASNTTNNAHEEGKISYVIGGNVFKADQQIVRLPAKNPGHVAHHQARNPDNKRFDHEKTHRELANDLKLKPGAAFKVKAEIPLYYEPDLVRLAGPFNPPPPAVAEQILIDRARPDYQPNYIKFGELKFELDPEQGIFLGGNIGISIVKKSIVINKPILDGLKNINGTEGFHNALIGFFKDQGFDLNKLILERIEFECAPSAGFGLGLGKNGVEAGAKAVLGNMNMKIIHQANNKIDEFTCQINLGAKGGLVLKNVEGKNGKEGMQQKKSLAVGMWEISYLQRDNEVINKPSPLSQPINGHEQMKNRDIIIEVDSIVAIKHKDVLTKCNNADEKNIANQTFQNRLAHTQQRLMQINHGVANVNRKADAIFLVIGELYADMQQRREEKILAKEQTKVLANFQGIINAFGMIQKLGNQINNKYLEVVGVGGMAIAQAVLGVAQIEGFFGLPKAEGLAMLDPATSIVGAVMMFGSLFMRRSGDKAMQQIAKLIVKMHKDMIRGFDIIIENQKFTFELIENGFKSLNKGLYEIIQQNNRLESKIDFLEFKIDHVLAMLQEARIYDQAKDLRKLEVETDLLSRGPDNLPVERFEERINKVLSKINSQLELVKMVDCCSLTDMGNQLPGWFHVRKLESLFLQDGFSDYAVDFRHIGNLHWWWSAFACYLNILPHINSKNIIGLDFQAQILRKITLLSQRTKIFFTIIRDKKFINEFLSHYRKQFDDISKKVGETLSDLSSNYSKEVLSRWANECLAFNVDPTEETRTAVIKDIIKNMQELVADKMNQPELKKEVAAYVELRKEFGFFVRILSSFLGGEFLQAQYQKLNDIDLDRYPIFTIEEQAKQFGEHTFHLPFLSGSFENQLCSFSYKSDELNTWYNKASLLAQAIQETLENTENFARHYRVIVKTIKQNATIGKQADQIIAELPDMTKADALNVSSAEKKTMKKYYNIEKIIALMQPALDICQKVEPTSAPILVFGASGVGKSTWLNYMFKFDYKLIQGDEDHEDTIVLEKQSLPEKNLNLLVVTIVKHFIPN